MWYYFLFSDKSILADFFFKWDKEKSAKLCILEILKILSQLNGAAQDLFKLKMKKRLHFLKVHQKLTKQSDLIFFDILHISPCFGHLLLNVYKMFGLRLCKNFPTNYFLAWCIQREFKKNLQEHLTKPRNYFFKLLVRLNPVCAAKKCLNVRQKLGTWHTGLKRTRNLKK